MGNTNTTAGWLHALMLPQTKVLESTAEQILAMETLLGVFNLRSIYQPKPAGERSENAYT